MEHFELQNNKKESLVVWISTKDVMNSTKQLFNSNYYNLGHLLCARSSTVHYCSLGCKQLTQVPAQNLAG